MADKRSAHLRGDVEKTQAQKGGANPVLPLATKLIAVKDGENKEKNNTCNRERKEGDDEKKELE